MSPRRNISPEEHALARAQGHAYIAVNWIQCPACDNRQAGPIHRTSIRLWQGRADRAQRHDGVDPLSGVTLADAERHLAVRAAQMPSSAPAATVTTTPRTTCVRLRQAAPMTARPDYGPRQLADYLGAFYGQVDRARSFGLLPEPDKGGGRRWSAAAADKIHARWPEIRAAVECIGAPGLRQRGWTEAMIRDLLGKPDVLTDNPHFKTAAPRRLWLLQKVEAAEATPEFASRRDRAARQCAAAAKASGTRKLWKALGGA